MADIAIVLKDLFSGKLNSITNANKGLSKSIEETQKKAENYSKKLNSLNSNLAKQQTQLQKVSKELKEAKKAFDACADAANSDALTEAHRKYNDLQDSIADTKRSAKEATLCRASGGHNFLFSCNVTNFIFCPFVLDFRPRLCYPSTDNKYGYRGAIWN